MRTNWLLTLQVGTCMHLLLCGEGYRAWRLCVPYVFVPAGCMAYPALAYQTMPHDLCQHAKP